MAMTHTFTDETLIIIAEAVFVIGRTVETTGLPLKSMRSYTSTKTVAAPFAASTYLTTPIPNPMTHKATLITTTPYRESVLLGGFYVEENG